MMNEFVGSIEISKYSFNKWSLKDLSNNLYIKNLWPVTYIITGEKSKEMYIGESTNAISRMGSHLSNPARNSLDSVCIISSDKFNKSAVLDIESNLIKYFAADGKYKLQNNNLGIANHNYYQKEEYSLLFRKLWAELGKEDLTVNNLDVIDNSDLFKYSPYKSLSEDQNRSVLKVLKLLTEEDEGTIFIEGSAGTGKTILAVYIIKILKSELLDYQDLEDGALDSEVLDTMLRFKEKFQDPKVALVVPMTSLRKTLKKVFKNIKGLSTKMVIGPSDVAKSKFDLLIVDEAHRLRKRKNITNYKSFDDANKALGFSQNGNELDWVLKQSDSQIFFYDSDQSIKPSDVNKEDFDQIKKNAFNLQLTSQMRVEGGVDYINFIDELLHCKIPNSNYKFESDNYELLIYESLELLIDDLRDKEVNLGLCRLVAGYSWEWKSKKEDTHDIEIDSLQLKWNSTNEDWINSPDAFNEVGCIHTTQGYDLNYVGIIFGNEIRYDPLKNRIFINAKEYYDRNGKAGIDDPAKLKEYIINIYKTLMLRGIKGTYLYVCDPDLREYFKNHISLKE
jgi:DUF2075 family protein/DNA replication protein DnaC